MRCEAGRTVSSGSSLSADVEGALAAELLLSTRSFFHRRLTPSVAKEGGNDRPGSAESLTRARQRDRWPRALRGERFRASGGGAFESGRMPAHGPTARPPRGPPHRLR